MPRVFVSQGKEENKKSFENTHLMGSATVIIKIACAERTMSLAEMLFAIESHHAVHGHGSGLVGA